jgi:hypothetical protein
VAALVEKIGSVQVPTPGTEVAVLRGGTVVAVLVVVGTTVVIGAAVVVVDGTFVVVGIRVTGTAVARGSPGGGVVVADAATP